MVEGLAGAGLTKRARVVVEKPFGHDLASARALNAELRKLLEEWQIFRIDHFLGKEPAMDILFLRFANAIFEPLWNRDHIAVRPDHHGRGLRRGGPGQLLRPGRGAARRRAESPAADRSGLIASEPPSVADADGLRDKRVEVFRAMPPADPQHYVRGQYDGYLSVPGVSPGSQTETFAALRLEIDNWRWSGVPFFIRAGKELPERVTEVRIIFKPPPRLTFAPQFTPHPNEFILRIDPDSRSRTWWSRPRSPVPETTLRTIDLSLIFSEELGDPPEPYERLLGDALRGRRQPLHPRGQRGGDVAHRAATAGRATPGGALRLRVLGTRRRERPGRRAPALA